MDTEDKQEAKALFRDTRETAKALFEYMDTDRDGRLSKSDFITKYLELNPNVIVKQCEAVWSLLDTNNDGYIGPQPFFDNFETIISLRNQTHRRQTSIQIDDEHVDPDVFLPIMEEDGVTDDSDEDDTGYDKEALNILKSEFDEADTSHVGYLNYTKFKSLVTKFVSDPSDQQLRDIIACAKGVEADEVQLRSVQITFENLLTAFHRLAAQDSMQATPMTSPDTSPQLSPRKRSSFFVRRASNMSTRSEASPSPTRMLDTQPRPMLHRPPRITDTDARKMFDWADRDEDGRINLDELQLAVLHYTGRRLDEKERDDIKKLLSLRSKDSISLDEFHSIMKTWQRKRKALRRQSAPPESLSRGASLEQMEDLPTDETPQLLETLRQHIGLGADQLQEQVLELRSEVDKLTDQHRSATVARRRALRDLADHEERANRLLLANESLSKDIRTLNDEKRELQNQLLERQEVLKDAEAKLAEMHELELRAQSLQQSLESADAEYAQVLKERDDLLKENDDLRVRVEEIRNKNKAENLSRIRQSRMQQLYAKATMQSADEINGLKKELASVKEQLEHAHFENDELMDQIKELEMRNKKSPELQHIPQFPSTFSLASQLDGSDPHPHVIPHSESDSSDLSIPIPRGHAESSHDVQELKMQLEKNLRDIEQLTEDKAALLRTIAELKHQHSEELAAREAISQKKEEAAAVRTAKLEESLNETTRRASEAQSQHATDKAQLTTRVADLESSLAAAERTADEHERSFEKERKALQNELVSAKAELSNTKKDNEAVTLQQGEEQQRLLARVATLERQLVDVESNSRSGQKATAKTEAQLVSRVTELEHELHQTNVENTKLLGRLQSEVEQANSRVKRLQGELSAAHADLAVQRNTHQEAEDSLRSRVAGLEEQLAEASNKLSAAQSHHQRTASLGQQEAQRLAEQVAGVKAELEHAQRNATRYKADAERFRQEAAALRDALNQARDELVAASQDLVRVKDEEASLMLAHANTVSQLDESLDALRKARSDSQRLSAQLRRNASELVDQKTHTQEQDRTISELRGQWMSEQQRTQDLERRLQASQAHAAQQRMMIRDLQIELSHANARASEADSGAETQAQAEHRPAAFANAGQGGAQSTPPPPESGSRHSPTSISSPPGIDSLSLSSPQTANIYSMDLASFNGDECRARQQSIVEGNIALHFFTGEQLVNAAQQVHPFHLVQLYLFLKKFELESTEITRFELQQAVESKDADLQDQDELHRRMAKVLNKTHRTHRHVGTLRPNQVKEFLQQQGASSMEEYLRNIGEMDEDKLNEQSNAQARWNLSKAHDDARIGFERSETQLLDVLQKFGLTTSRRRFDNGDMCVLILRGDDVVTTEEVHQAVHDIEQLFAAPNIFDFHNIAAAVVDMAAKALIERLPTMPRLEQMNSIEVKHTTSSHTDYMVPYECAYQANMAQSEILVPDPTHLSLQHLKFMQERVDSKSLGEFYLKFMFGAMRVPCHEVIHCVQHLANQQDYDQYSWSAEHDASYACDSLFWQVANTSAFQTIFPPGLAEDVIWWSHHHAEVLASHWPESVCQEYLGWRNSFGLNPPSLAVCQDLILASQFKAVLTREGFFPDDRKFRKQLQLLFSGRSGEVHEHEVRIPKSLQRPFKPLPRLSGAACYPQGPIRATNTFSLDVRGQSPRHTLPRSTEENGQVTKRPGWLSSRVARAVGASLITAFLLLRWTRSRPAK